jgi:hypothetical protein
MLPSGPLWQTEDIAPTSYKNRGDSGHFAGMSRALGNRRDVFHRVPGRSVMLAYSGLLVLFRSIESRCVPSHCCHFCCRHSDVIGNLSVLKCVILPMAIGYPAEIIENYKSVEHAAAKSARQY